MMSTLANPLRSSASTRKARVGSKSRLLPSLTRLITSGSSTPAPSIPATRNSMIAISPVTEATLSRAKKGSLRWWNTDRNSVTSNRPIVRSWRSLKRRRRVVPLARRAARDSRRGARLRDLRRRGQGSALPLRARGASDPEARAAIRHPPRGRASERPHASHLARAEDPRQDPAHPDMASGLRLPLGRTAAEVRPADRAAPQAPVGPGRDLGAPRRPQSARAPPPLDVRHALHLEPAIQAVDRAPVARRRRGGAQRTGRTGGLMAAVRAESARAARDCDLRSRVRVARPRVAACAVPVPTTGFPSRRALARPVERSAPRLGPGSVQHARLAGARREPRPTLSVARRAARAVARVSRDGGLAAGARLPPREGRRSLRPANQVA